MSAPPPQILVLQHIDVEDLGYLHDLMQQDHFGLTTVRLDLGEKIPAHLEQFDAMFSMGGPMDTCMEREFPWLVDEKKAIREFVVALEKPFMGFCLGCQLLGEVVGGEVVKSASPEVGIFDIRINGAGRRDKIFSGFPQTFKALQWHSWEVANLRHNKDVTMLGSTDTTECQIFKYREHAYGIQFHIEIKDHTVSAWGEVPEYRRALEQSLGGDGLGLFNREALENLKDINRCAEIFYNQLKTMLRETR